MSRRWSSAAGTRKDERNERGMLDLTHTLTVFPALFLLLAAVDCREAAVVRTGKWAKNPNVEECVFKLATIKPAGSDVQPCVIVNGCAPKPEVLSSDWQ